MNTNTLNNLNEEVESLIERHQENLTYIDWINDVSRKFLRSHQSLCEKPQPLNGWDQSRLSFIEKDFSMFMSKLMEQEIEAHTENIGLVKKINELEGQNVNEESPKTNDKYDEINIISPIPCEKCNEIWCICYENGDEIFGSDYEEFWEDYYTKMVNKLADDDQ